MSVKEYATIELHHLLVSSSKERKKLRKFQGAM